LVRAGYTTQQAILAQLATAVAAFAGTASAIAISTTPWAEERLLWITSGGFLYLAGTTILPEVLNENGPETHSSTRTRRIGFRLAQLLAFGVGILFLSMVDILSGGHDHHHHHGSHLHETNHHREALHSAHSHHVHDNDGHHHHDHSDHPNHDEYDYHDDHSEL
jgi:ZIP Zinc transporter